MENTEPHASSRFCLRSLLLHGLYGILRKQAEKDRSEKHAKKMEEDECLTAVKCFSIQVG